MLVFLMSGVMFLFSTLDVYAQNNAKREFKFHQENIRSKKRNNDLQKARRVKGRSNQKNGSNLTFKLHQFNMRQMLQKAVDIHFKVNYQEICSPQLKEDEEMKEE